MRFEHIQPLCVRVDLEVMVMKEYSKLLRSPELDHYYQMQSNVIPRIAFVCVCVCVCEREREREREWERESYPSAEDTVSIFYALLIRCVFLLFFSHPSLSTIGNKANSDTRMQKRRRTHTYTHTDTDTHTHTHTHIHVCKQPLWSYEQVGFSILIWQNHVFFFLLLRVARRECNLF